MAQILVLDDLVTATPGAYPKYTVQNTAVQLSATGTLVFVGEAAQGPDWSLETDLSQNVFGPGQLSAVVSKYGSGRLVDAFRGAVAASNDPDIAATFSAAVLIKTNVSGKAQSALSKVGGGTYATLADRTYGQLGNLLYYTVSDKVAEVVPTTGAYTWLPPIAALDMSIRADGGAAVAYTAAAGQLPAAFVSGLHSALNGASSPVDVTGGASRGVLGGVTGNLIVTVSGAQATFTYDGTWALTPSAGDTVYVPSGSAIQGGTNKNRGAYVVTSATVHTIVATKLLDAAGSPGTATNPEAVGSTAVAATTDLQAFAPVTIAFVAGAVVPGIGKNFEVAELATGTDRLSNSAYALSTTKVAWVSKTGAPQLVTSSAEEMVQLNVNRQADGIMDSVAGGGTVVLALGYQGTTGTCTITPSALTTAVTGGSGVNLTLNLAHFTTLNDLAAFISAQAGYTCSVPTALSGQINPLAIDEGTFGICTTWGAGALRLKADALAFFQAISSGTGAVQLDVPPSQALAGLPALVASPVYLSGGSLGGTSDAQFQAAIDAARSVDCNFSIPLISQDAAADIAIGATDSTSTYTVAGTNAYLRAHVLAMSTRKARRSRQAFMSYRGTYRNAKLASANLANGRCSLAFQDVLDVGATGIVQYQPWMGAVKAAAMQAGGAYKAITHKLVACNGVVQAAGDFNYKDPDQVEDAIRSGLLFMEPADGGGFEWVVDQTTYGADGNFVFNSIQAIYDADTVLLTVGKNMSKSFTGKSTADVGAGNGLQALKGYLAALFAAKWIAPSPDDGAALGYKNLSVTISGATMAVKGEVKLSTEILFVPIDFSITMVQSSAST